MHKRILKLAIPNILSNISVPLITSVDTILMGHLSIQHLGALGIGGMIFNFLYWNFGFLRMGPTGLTAQAFGKGDFHECGNLLFRGAFLALFLSFFLILLGQPILFASSFLMNISSEHSPLVSQYFSIRVFAAPATLALNAIFGWFFGMQNALYPLYTTVVLNVVNIILSYTFVNYYNLGIRGVAWGTLIAQYSGLAISCLLIFISYRKKLASP